MTSHPVKITVHSTVTSKGQITLPKVVRDHLGTRPGTRLEFVLEDGSVRVCNSAPAADPLQAWFGSMTLPGGQTAAEWVRELRDQNEGLNEGLDGGQPVSMPQPGQRITYLNPDGTRQP
ncbi:AbrB/MazE/SpoVT family DNA-binding domain-containing protein [Deinococcus marmoris]|uniref:AbrB/MazE/SpoVT family DNA-binding domain-containing protein n=1 Tax=Deinococcus marmoris TaxID=249408 RepID=UPI00055447C7|nr:AbrB/MazE/SpoVT family DNA-binding domain-containing protein [Deinococcus marmoris]